MFYFNTLNLNQISGGNQVKQGDFGSTFTYKLADEKNKELDAFDQKTAYVNLVLKNNIVFTTTVIVDGSTVTFNVDKAIPTGLYFLEIKIDSYIFPSDRQTIILVTAGAVAYDLKDLVPNYDINMTISSILSDLSRKGIDISDLNRQIGNANAELIASRNGKSNLKTRIDDLENETTAQLAQTVNKGEGGVITLEMLSQKVKTAMTGGSVPVVGEDAVGTVNVIDNAITLPKVDKSIVPVSYTVRDGNIPSLEVKADGFDVLTLSRDDTDLIKWGNKYYWIPLNTVVTASTSLGEVSVVNLFFQTLDKTFRLVSYFTPMVAGEIFITNLSRRDTLVGFSGGNGFNYELNNVMETKTFLPQCQWQAYGSANPYNIDYTNKKIKFNEVVDFNFGHQFVLAGIAKNQELDLTDVLDPNKTSLWYLIINRLTKEVKIIEYTNNYLYRNSYWWHVTPIRRKSPNFIFIENDLTKNEIYSNASIKFINGINGRFVVNKSNATLVYRSEWSDFAAITDAGYVGNALIDGYVIKLPLKSEILSTALVMFYDRLNNKFEFMSFDKSPSTIDASRYIYFGSVRRVFDANGQLTMFTADLPIPWEYEGKLYGMYSGTYSGQSYPSVAIDAPVRCIHHRGYSLKYPEDTLKAYRESKKIGVNEVEMDIAWTSDMIPVNLHDVTINRTARDVNGNPPTVDINITDITLAQAREYEYGSWKSLEFKGEKIPTFEDCIIQSKALNQQLHLDRSYYLTQEKFDILAGILDKHKFYDVVWYINNATTCQMIRAKYPNAKLAFLLFGDVNQTAIDICKQFNSDESECAINAQATLITDANVALALSQKVPVTVWSADGVDRKHLIEIGVTGIATDSVNIQQELLG